MTIPPEVEAQFVQDTARTYVDTMLSAGVDVAVIMKIVVAMLGISLRMGEFERLKDATISGIRQALNDIEKGNIQDGGSTKH